MDKKLLFEVDLSASSQSVGDKGKQLALVGRNAVRGGDLDSFGDRVFTDGRVRAALSTLAVDPPAVLIEAPVEAIGHPKVSVDGLKRSVARIFDAPLPAAPASGKNGQRLASAATGPPAPFKGREFPLDHHLGNKSAVVVDLFNEVNDFSMALGRMSRVAYGRFYVGYFRGKKSFFAAEPQKLRLWIYSVLDPGKTQPWNGEAMRDVTSIGHFGMGDTEYSLASEDQLDELRERIQAAHDLGG